MSSRAICILVRNAGVVCITVLLSVTALWASVSGSISGSVKDPSGSVVPNAHVTVKESDTGLSYETRTDSKGYYTFPVLPVGNYQLNDEPSAGSTTPGARPWRTPARKSAHADSHAR